MKKQPDTPQDQASLRDKIIGLSESSGRKSYYPMLQQKIRELQGEITERHRAETTLRDTLDRIIQQQTAIDAISKCPDVFHGRLRESAPRITETMCQALGTAQASIWSVEGDLLRCLDMYVTETSTHLTGQTERKSTHADYFSALENARALDIHDTMTDPRAASLKTSYLEPNAITAMLDAPVMLEGKLVGIVCFEATNGPREWQPDEVSFAGRIADQMALILTAQQRRLAEEQLRETHLNLKNNLEFTRVLLEAVPIPIFYKDSKQRYLGCNRSFSQIMGVTTEEMVGKQARDFWPDLAQAYEDADTELLSRGGNKIYEAVIRTKEGELRDVIFAKQVFSDDRNQISGIIGSFLDITERNKTAAETARLRSLLSNIINSMPSMLVGVDAQGRIAQWNQQAERITGFSEKDVQGQPLDQALPWLREEMDKVRQAIARKEPLFESKVCRHHHGEHHFEDITIYPLITNGVEGAVIRIDDVTDRVRIEDMLVQSEKMLSVGGLAAGMAHEINNPLASIMGNTQVVETRLAKPLAQNLQAAQEAGISFDGLQQYLEKRGILKMLHAVHSSGAQAAQIVSNMLSFSRKSDSSFLPEDITELLDKTLTLAATDYDLKKNYDFKKIEIVRNYETSLPLVHCSASKLQQVFLNLLRNGSEAMSEKHYADGAHPRFTIRAFLSRPWLRIEIEDNGPGLSETVRKRIFEPFFTTKPIGRGTGLGLSVSYFIITEGHGGQMSVLTAQGRWTRFVIELPLDSPRK